MNFEKKRALFHKILSHLEDNLKVLMESALEAKDAATNEESVAENKYDTRGLEASYLAGAQARRAEKLKEDIFLLKKVELPEHASEDSIGVGSLVQLDVNGENIKWVFILPAGGINIEFEEYKVQTISLEAPLGKALFKSEKGDVVDFNKNEYEILQLV